MLEAQARATLLTLVNVNAHLCLSLFLLLTSQRLSLGLNALLSPLTGSLGLRTLGVHLVLDLSLTRLLGFGLVDL